MNFFSWYISIHWAIFDVCGAASLLLTNIALNIFRNFFFIEFIFFSFTFWTGCVELPDFCASRDCCCVLAADDDDDDIVSHAVSGPFAGNVVFVDVSHLSETFIWPCSEEVKLDRLTDDIEKCTPNWLCWSNRQWFKLAWLNVSCTRFGYVLGRTKSLITSIYLDSLLLAFISIATQSNKTQSDRTTQTTQIRSTESWIFSMYPRWICYLFGCKVHKWTICVIACLNGLGKEHLTEASVCV